MRHLLTILEKYIYIYIYIDVSYENYHDLKKTIHLVLFWYDSQ